MNAASLAQSLCSCWQQHSTPGASMHANTLAPMWGAEFLPSVLGGPDEDRAAENIAAPDSPSASSANLADRQVHKQRFVWTADLHQRFEAAVKSLGIDHAKPQAISQLMNCEGEGAPTRQNIKSHLQKYRLLMQKRARQTSTASATAVPTGGAGAGSAASGASSAAAACGIASAASDSSTSGGGPAGASGANRTTSVAPSAVPSSSSSSNKAAATSQCAADGHCAGTSLPGEQSFILPAEQCNLEMNLEQHLERQELNLKVQMELQTKLHRQLLVQRQLQHQLEHSFNSGDSAEGFESQRRRAAAALKNSLRERLTKHVLMQEEMLQHLDALVSSEVSKPAAQSNNADQTRAAAMIRAVTGAAASAASASELDSALQEGISVRSADGTTSTDAQPAVRVVESMAESCHVKTDVSEV